MLFPTVTFAIFFMVVMGGSWLLRPHPLAWRLGLIASGAVFYAWWDERFLGILAAVIAGNDLVARGMTRWDRWRAWLLALGVAGNLAVLGFFKYYDFFTTSLVDALEPFGLDPSPPLVEVILPIGISFFTFEAIAYLMEIHRGVTGRVPTLDLATHLTFFPKLLSGPITRPSELVPQLAGRPSTIEASEALWRIGRGLVKKLVIATYLADTITDDVFSTPAQHSAGEVLVGIYAYTAQLYVDFSAYTDMAIGLALLLGIRLPENFNAPYTAISIQNFWNRWHMSLSRWLRDFLFQPLVMRGSRGRIATSRNILIVMLLTGLWHGAAWTFVVWGGIHGTAMVVSRQRREWRRAHRRPRPADTTWRRLRARVITFHVVAFAWVFFRAESLGRAREVLARLTHFGPTDALDPLLVAVVIGSLAAQWLPKDWTERVRHGFARSGPVIKVAALGLVLLFVDGFGPEGVPPFIYFGF